MLDDEPTAAGPQDEDPWTQRYYPRGTQGFERVVLFSDAVYAISLTLIAVQLVLPAITSLSQGTATAPEVISAGMSNVIAYAFTFTWVAFYWKANHRFTLTLRRMNDLYIWAVLVYLGFIALLPFPASVLGEAWNPLALAFFFGYMACVSFLEVVLMLIAFRADLYVRQLTPSQQRRWVLPSLAPVVGALLSIPVCFIPVVGGYLAIATMVGVSMGLGVLFGRLYPVQL